jgi:hypothetical protein
MEILGTNFTITLGGWRLRFVFAVEETETPPAPKQHVPHRLRVMAEDEWAAK